MRVFNRQKEDGNIIRYFPDDNFIILTDTLNLKTGKIEQKKVVEFSVHNHINMFKITIPYKYYFEEFFVSDDHSLIVYDSDLDEFMKESPVVLSEIKDIGNLYLVRAKKYVQTMEEYEYLNDPKYQDVILIPLKDISIEKVDKSTGYDLTVEDNFTFVTDRGTVIQDTMAVFVPFSKESIEEAKKLTNPYSPANPRRLKYVFNKDFQYGVCILTSDPPVEFANKYWWWKETYIQYHNEKYLTTEGRKVLYDFFTDEEKEKIDINYFTKKTDINELSKHLLYNIEVDRVLEFIDFVKEKVLDVITVFNSAITIKDLELSKKVKPLVDKLDENKDLKYNQEILNEINRALKEEIKKNSQLKFLLNCGVLKFNQMVQLLAVKGLVLSPTGEVKLIKGNFTDGLTPVQYFESGHGARMGIVSRAQKTAITGYLQRQMIYATASVELDPTIVDCNTSKTLTLKLDEDLSYRLINRYIIQDGKKVKITEDNYKDFIGKVVYLRTPLYCITDKVCKTCYGDDYQYIQSTKIGFVAAETIGERFSQEMMKAFHTGGLIKFKFLNPIEETIRITNNRKELYEKVIEYKDHKLYAKDDVELYLEKEYFNLRGLINEVSDSIGLDMLLGLIRTKDETLDLICDFPVILYSGSNITQTKDYYIISYQKGDQILQVEPIVDDVETKAKAILTILNGKGKFKDVDHLLLKVYNEIKSFGDFILVHLEVLLSQIIRCPDDPSKPYRLCGNFSKQPVLYGIKRIPYLESWVRGLEFERIGDAIVNGLIEHEIKRPSLLDKMLIEGG